MIKEGLDYGGGTRSRTEVDGFAIRCMATLPFRLIASKQLERHTRLELVTSTLALCLRQHC